MKPKYWIIPDIHGELGNLLRLMRLIRKNGFSFKKGHRLIQLGDRNDRGPDSYRVNNFFYKLSKRYPEQVICLLGNHDQMLLDAAMPTPYRNDLMYYNGGNATLKSYQRPTKHYGKNMLYYMLRDTGHWDWLRNQPYYYETEDYFFSHAPIPKEAFRSLKPGDDFRLDKHTLTWSYVEYDTEVWVDPDCTTEGKITVHGHIHGLKSERIYHDADGNRLNSGIYSPGVRQHGNAILLDTGSGCCEDSTLTCLLLPDMVTFDSKGDIKTLEK